MKFLVTNEQPRSFPPERLHSDLLQLFQDATQPGLVPFEHQGQSMLRVLADEQLFLVAGTAAGKTLAVATPLFFKLREGQIRKILFMYPTLALLEDQRRVLQQLAEASGLDEEVGQIQGGISRSALIHNLNKRVLLATPDAIYWFFRKNVKYNALLVYGLSQIDEFVLDEAHLFNGLMLHNFEHLWKRVKTLAGLLGKTPRLHILTATPTEALKRLNEAEPIEGRSKCSDVPVEFRACDWFDRAEHFIGAVNDVLEAGGRKVLVVCNSARMAHQLFEKYKVRQKDASAIIPTEHLLRFGQIKLGSLIEWLERVGVQQEVLDELSTRLFREEDVVLGDVNKDTQLELPLQDVVLHAAEALERQCWRVKRALWERSQHPGETWESLLNNRPLPCRIINTVREPLMQVADVEEQQRIMDEWLAETTDRLGNIDEDPIPCRASEYGELTNAFASVGLDTELASLLTKRLQWEMKADPEQLPVRNLSHRPVYLRWLHRVMDADTADTIRDAVRKGIESGELQVECRHIGLWRGSDVPVIVYSGSMARQAREGLIGVFADPDLERAVLISTSAVEVGVDFHADVLVTEECEGKSFLQRFGRVGRHGAGSKVIALVSHGVLAALGGLDECEVDREKFSNTIVARFPLRDYAAGSRLVDANHYLVNEQLGRIGKRLNTLPDLTEIKPLADQLRAAEIRLGFGLRSTMPQIALRDGVTKDPFYLLRYVDDDDLRPADSPFEVARARRWFTELIFKPAAFDIVMDLDITLKASEHLTLLHGDRPQVYSQRGIGLFHLGKLCEQIPWSESQPLYFLLLHGDVYLSRLDRGLTYAPPECVRDSEQNPLFIPDQTYLVLAGWLEVDPTRELLEGAGIADWEELHCDWERLGQDWNQVGMVVLEKTTGACFAACQKLVAYVS